jgi:glutamate formiminotransferase
VYECVINLAEGRDQRLLAEFDRAAGESWRDRHSDVDHHRSVFTLINDVEPLRRDVRALLSLAYQRLDLRHHSGVHPRLGVVDVVPFVPYDDEPTVAVALRDETAAWIAAEFAVPTFLYGPLATGSRTLPDVRRRAFTSLEPDFGPSLTDEVRGATCVGERDLLVAWNVLVRGASLPDARAVARAVRGPHLRALGFEVASGVQVSCNLIEPMLLGPGDAYDAIAAALAPQARIVACELVGLVPRAVLRRESPDRWAQLGLSEAATIESRL